MNTLDAKGLPVVGGYVAAFRPVHKVDYRLVKEGGKPKIFPTEAEAEVAGWRALRPHLERDIVGDGDRLRELYKTAHERIKSKLGSRRRLVTWMR